VDQGYALHLVDQGPEAELAVYHPALVLSGLVPAHIQKKPFEIIILIITANQLLKILTIVV
jgi:hypothetical protein